MKPTVITDISQLDLNQTYSYADYLLWEFGERLELIKGKIFKMSPAPNRNHQRISMALTKQILYYIDQVKCSCELFAAPFDVRLFDSKKSKKSEKEIYTVYLLPLLMFGYLIAKNLKRVKKKSIPLFSLTFA